MTYSATYSAADMRRICAHCSRAFQHHKGGESAKGPEHRCPATGAFPSWDNRLPEDAAGALFDSQLSAYWGTHNTTFKAAV